MLMSSGFVTAPQSHSTAFISCAENMSCLIVKITQPVVGGLTNINSGDIRINSPDPSSCRSSRPVESALCSVHFGYMASLITLNASPAISGWMTDGTGSIPSITSALVYTSGSINDYGH